MSKKVALISALVALMIPAFSSAAIDGDLRLGSHGDKVKELQTFLIAQGFLSGAATGNFFTLTQKAVKAFQIAQHLPPTGFVGPMTRALINKNPTSAPQASAAEASSSDPLLSGLSSQVADLLKQIDALRGRGTATSSLQQTYATSTSQFTFDPTWRDAVVNLYCMSRYGDLNDASSGSGVVIDPRGVILTNAHVAQSFIFSEWPNPSLLDCYVRVGSPATPKYRAALLYIPDEYMTKNISDTYKYNAEDSVVYGRKDYALLLITGTSDPAGTLPSTFPSMSVYENGVLPVNTPVFLSGYSAEFLGGIALQRNLNQLTSQTVVAAQQPIGSSTVPQAIAFSGNISSQHGASGGAVIAPGGKVAGLMSFLNKDYGASTGDRVLSAITTDYILKDFLADNKISLFDYISTSDLKALSKKFMTDNGSRYQQGYAELWKERDFAVPGI